MKIRNLGVVIVLGSLASWVQAEEEDEHEHKHHAPSYSYLEISSIGYDMDFAGIDVEPDGYKLKLSLALGDSLFGVIDRSDSDGKFAGSNYDFDTQGYGFGLRGDSWFASYTYNTWELSGNEFDVDTIRVGFRNDWTDRLEFNASYSWNNIEDADNDDGFQVGFLYRLGGNFHLVAEYETIGGDLDIDILSAGIRMTF
tara:strand:- start:1190 stop:1783 length:594 start_codon:yes stop_codon:yes gene_type:complete